MRHTVQQLCYESDQSQPKYVTQYTWSNPNPCLQILINWKTFSDTSDWKPIRPKRTEPPLIKRIRKISLTFVAFYFSKNNFRNQWFTAETFRPFKPRTQSLKWNTEQAHVLCNRPYFVICVYDLPLFAAQAISCYCQRSCVLKCCPGLTMFTHRICGTASHHFELSMMIEAFSRVTATAMCLNTVYIAGSFWMALLHFHYFLKLHSL